MDQLKKKFGKVIRRRREAVGLSQEALAAAAGLHQTYISMLERGRHAPSLVVIQKLAASLETNMTCLMAEVEGVTHLH